jgi:carbamoyl-phosphate synthase large subunit
MSMLSSACQLADRAFVVPRCTDEAFVSTVLELCDEHHVALVVPTIDTELATFAAARERFASIGTTVAISGAHTIALGADKFATNAWLTDNGFPTVRQSTPARVLAEPDAWRVPLVAKPSAGSASSGVRFMFGPEQLEELVDDATFVVEERAVGDEHTVDVLVGRDGSVRDVVVRRRLEVRGGEVSKAVTVRDEEVIDLARTVCDALPDAYGVLTVQLFVDPDTRTMRIIEINPRFGGGFPLSWEAGARFPQWLLEEVLDLPSTCVPGAWRDGLVMLRYDDAVFVDAADVGL